VQLVIDLDAPTAPFIRHSETSRAAAESINPGLGDRQLAVLRYFADHPEGLTDEALIEHCVGLGWSANGPRSRRVELVERGFVADSGRKLVGSSGRLACVWQITTAGLARLQEEG
jgi:hypothetical protein